MNYPRIVRINEILKENISLIFQSEIKDPRIGFVTITSVETSCDLKQAVVYLSILGNKKEIDEAVKAIEHAKSHIRSELGKRIKLKFLPELVFKIDESIEHGIRIQELIKKIHEESPDE